MNTRQTRQTKEHSLTRWQIRLPSDLEAYIRNKANTERRSINATITLIVEEHIRLHKHTKSQDTKTP